MKIHLMGEPWEIQDVVAMLQERVPIDSSSRPTSQRGGICSVMVSILPEALERLHDPKWELADVVADLRTMRQALFDELFGDGPPPTVMVAASAHCHCPTRPAPGTICPRCGGVEARR